MDPREYQWVAHATEGSFDDRVTGAHNTFDDGEDIETAFDDEWCIGELDGLFIITDDDDFQVHPAQLISAYNKTTGSKLLEIQINSNLPPAPADNAGIQVSSPISGRIYITLIKGGTNAPYSTNSQDGVASNDAIIQMDGQICDSGSTAGEFDGLPGGDALWSAGETIVLDTDCSGSFTTPSSNALVSQSEHSISVAIRGNVTFTGTVTVR